jgi:antitoxin CcdA
MNAHAPRKPTNVSLDSLLLEDARNLGINISRACERGLASEVAEARARLWREENQEAIAASNSYVARKGLPLAKHRLF